MKNNSSSFSVFLIGLTLICLGDIGKSYGQSTVHVVLRYDDYSSLSSLDLEKKMLRLFKKYHTPCVFGVIPEITNGKPRDPSPSSVYPLDSLKIDLLRQGIREGSIEIALHGLTHQSAAYKIPSEFIGLPYEAQCQRLLKGKSFLEQQLGVLITSFIPPWNAYDKNTLRALESTGFALISGDIEGPSHSPSSLNYIPATCTLPHLFEALTRAQKIAHLSPNIPAPIITVYFHPYEFKEINSQRGLFSLVEFEKYLKTLSEKPSVTVITFEKLASLNHFLPETYSHYSRIFRYTPTFLIDLFRVSSEIYPYPSLQLPGIMVVQGFILIPIIFYGLIFLIFTYLAFVVAEMGLKRMPKLIHYWEIFYGILLGLVLFIFNRIEDFTTFSCLFFIMTLAMSCGFAFSHLKKRFHPMR